ncbi:MAG: UTP--glucose-1-phosphate uridylyltransferase [Planctomycetaceae bacterium]
MTDSIDIAALRKRLEAVGQSHVVRFWDELNDAQRGQLLTQIDSIDFDQLARLVAGEDEKPDFAALASKAAAPPAVKADGTGATWTAKEARAQGEQALSDGRVGAVIVAGGQGTRLGFDQPKGMFPIGPISGRTLFEVFADRLRAIARRYNVRVPLYLMTSPATHEDTIAYWTENNYLGLPPDDVKIFCQGTMPAVDSATGKVLLEEKGRLALSPDGHGGTVAALHRSGCLDDAASRGIDLLSYVQVDNPLVSLCDADLLGHHLMSGSEMTTQVVRKRFAKEKVGNVVVVDGRVQIIEYSDLPDEAANRQTESGELALWAGNIAVHVLDRQFLARAAKWSDALPFHRAHKSVPFIDERGQRIQPTAPNAIKFERFIFDLLPHAEHAFVVEALASEAFAPVKNANGAATDTPDHAMQAIIDLHRGWLESAGVSVAPGARVEINPLFAMDADELKSRLRSGERIDQDRYFTS